jgi:hypothetical protein
MVRGLVRCGLRSLAQGTHNGHINAEVKHLMEHDRFVGLMMTRTNGNQTYYGDDDELDSGAAGRDESKEEQPITKRKRVDSSGGPVQSFVTKPWYSNQTVRVQAGVFFGVEESGTRRVYRVSYCKEDEKNQCSAYCEEFSVLQTCPKGIYFPVFCYSRSAYRLTYIVLSQVMYTPNP